MKSLKNFCPCERRYWSNEWYKVPLLAEIEKREKKKEKKRIYNLNLKLKLKLRN